MPLPFDIRIASSAVVSAAGFDTAALWNSLLGGDTNLRNSNSSDESFRHPSSWGFVGESKGIKDTHGELIRFTTHAQVLAALLSTKLANADLIDVDAAKFTILATTKGNLEQWLSGTEPIFTPAPPSKVYGVLASEYGFPENAGMVVSNACVSGAEAVCLACDSITDGDVTSVEVIGTDALADFVLAGFDSLQARSKRPATPFDRNRDGLSLGEAAAGIVVANENALHDPGQSARIISYGCSNDANHISGPSRDGSGLALAIERALDGIDKSEIRAICAHGTATVYNDAMEARAFHTVFDGNPPPVFGIKGAIGHTLGAAGLIEVIISAKVATEGLIPPTVGYEQGEEDYPLDVVHGEPRKIEPGYVLTTNSGFGGMNTAIVIGPGRQR